MSQMRIDDTWHFIEAITAAKTSVEVEQVLLDLVGRYGFETAFGGIIPPASVGPAEIADFVLIQRFPAAWARRYNSRGYLFRDPILYRLQLPAKEAFSWEDAYKHCPSHDDATQIAGEAGEFGLKGGLVIPVELLDQCTVAVSFGGERSDYGSDDIKALGFATSCAIGKLLMHRADRTAPPPQLSRRELDALSWAAEGKSDWEIAVILGVSPATIQKHILAARTKLGAVTRGHAIAKAFRLNLFR